MKKSDLDAVERAYDKRLAKDFVEKLKGTVNNLTPEELKARIIAFMDDHCICALATCADNVPRSTALRYRNQGLTVYIHTEGGGKLKNIRLNPRVSLSICGEYTGFDSCTSLQLWGTAEVIKPHEKEQYEEVQRIVNLADRPDLKAAGITEIPDMYILKITVSRARYLNFPEGVLNQNLTT